MSEGTAPLLRPLLRTYSYTCVSWSDDVFSCPRPPPPSLRHQVPPQDKALVDKLIAAQEAAKSARRRMWQYGDMGESDDEL